MSAHSEAKDQTTKRLSAACGDLIARVDTLQAAVDRGANINGPLGDLRKAAETLEELVSDEPKGLDTVGPATKGDNSKDVDAVDGGNGRESADKSRESDDEISEVAAERKKK